MRQIKIIVGMILLLALIATSSNAQEMKKIGQAGIQFLKIDPTARSAAMAGAMTLASSDASSVFYNPAGIGRMSPKFDLVAGNTRWIADIAYNSISVAYSFGSLGTFALHGTFADYGDIQGAVRAPQLEQGFELTGNVDVSAYYAGLTYSRNLMHNFAVGGTVKYVSQHLGTSVLNDNSSKKNEVSGFGFDFGTIFYPGWNSFGFGISIRNFGPELEYEQESFEMPLTFSIGVSMNLLDVTSLENQKLLVSVDAEHPRDYTERLKFGAEYIFMDVLALRAGYKTNHDIEGFFGGFGLDAKLSGVGARIDYAYSDIQFFDAVHRFTIGLSY